MEVEGRWEMGKAWEKISHEQHQVDVGRVGTNRNKFKHSQAELSIASRVFTSGEVLKPI